MGRNDCIFTLNVIITRVHLIAPLKASFVVSLLSLVINKTIGISRLPLNHYFSDSLYRRQPKLVGLASWRLSFGGGWFLAAEVGGQWVIVDDGNGTVSCEKINPYNFPTTLVPECWSDATQDLIQR